MNPFRPWTRGRLIAVDCGSRCIKLLLVEKDGDKISVVGYKQVDLQEEGLLSTEEIQRHVAGLLAEWAEWPIAIVLPAHLSFSQVLDLPAGGESAIPKLIEEQTGRLRGVSSSPMVYEASALGAYGRFQKPYFVTIAREQDVDQHIQSIAIQPNEVRDVTSFADALASAHAALSPGLRDCILLDWGASDTVFTIVREGRQVFASSFAQGSRALVDALARGRNLALAEAEAQLGAQDLFTGANRVPALCAVVDGWRTEWRKTLDEWRKQNADGAGTVAGGPVILSGGVLRTAGLLHYLQSQGGLDFRLWPESFDGSQGMPLSDFAAVYGAAIAAFRRPLDTASLLPPPLRTHRRQLRQLAKSNIACVICLLLAGLVLGLATWHKASLVVRKRRLAEKAEAATVQIRRIENLVAQRDQAFERFWPLLDQQERTLDLLHTMRVLQQCRSHHDFWCVLLADNESYTRGTTLPAVFTNRFGLTNAAALAEETLSKPSFVIELCVPAQGEQAFKIVSDVLTELKQDPLFGRVDSVPAAQRRALVDPKVLIPDRHFAVSVGLADLGWRSLFETVNLPDLLSGSTNFLRRPALGPTLRSRPGPYISPGLAAPGFTKPDA